MPRINYFKLRDRPIKDNIFEKVSKKDRNRDFNNLSSREAYLIETKQKPGMTENSIDDEDVSIAEEFDTSESHIGDDLSIRAKQNFKVGLQNTNDVCNRFRSISLAAGLFSRKHPFDSWQKNILKGTPSSLMQTIQMVPIKEIVSLEKDCESTCNTAINGKEKMLPSFGRSKKPNIVNKKVENVILSEFNSVSSSSNFSKVEANRKKNSSKIINSTALSDSWKGKFSAFTGRSIQKCIATTQPKPKAPHSEISEEQHNFPSSSCKKKHF